ncbi:MAG: hypothetical protein LPL00_07850 [Alphaproteobacteria bacterium]|nr:hypothetical protein [Alphaproteobacteria bacterium]MDX5369503.1 hypothetical protein [Alphaproteobacteria bacterium]MDX5464161.1 hypothetical protein [Alphaproteobacteria bacterium]
MSRTGTTALMRAGSLAVMLGAALAAPAGAQTVPPAQRAQPAQPVETPRTEPAPRSGPLVILPPAAREGAPLTGTAPVFDRPIEGVAVERLGAVSGAGADLTARAGDGLGPDLWLGQRGNVVSGLMERVEPHPTARSMNALVARLLLTGAEPPDGRAARFGERRVAALQRFGRAGDAARLARALAGEEPKLRQMAADAILLDGNPEGACDIAEEVGQSPVAADPYWTKVRGYCAALAGNEAEALFETELLREGGIQDPAYYVLMDRLLFAFESEVPAYTEMTPLHLAMLRSADGALPLRRGQGVPAAYVSALLAAPGGPVDAAVLAVEAWQLALLDAGEVAARLDDVPADRRGPLAQAHAAAERARTPEERIAAVVRLMGDGAARERIALNAALAAPAAEDLPVMSGDPGLRGLMVEASVAVGDTARAYAWFEAPAPAEPAREAELEALLLVADPETPLARTPALATMLGASPPGLRRIALLDAFDLSRPLAANGSADVMELMDAARAGSRGETVLRAMQVLGGRPLADTDADRIAAVVRALDMGGFKAEARSLAVEAMLAVPAFAGR